MLGILARLLMIASRDAPERDHEPAQWHEPSQTSSPAPGPWRLPPDRPHTYDPWDRPKIIDNWRER